MTDLWSGLATDFQLSSVLWQVGTIAVCVAVGWALGRTARHELARRDESYDGMRRGVQSFSRVLEPMVALALIAMARPLLAQWQPVNLLGIAIPLLVSYVLIRLMFYVLRKVFARGGRVGNFLLLFEKAFALLVWTGAALYFTGLWPELWQYLEQTTIPIGRNKASLLTILQAASSVGVTLMLALWIGALLEDRLMRMDALHSSLRVVMARLGRGSLILIAVLVSLSLVGIDLTVLSVFGGALGVGLGLGLQKLVSSYVSGLVILLERSLAIGDVVTVANIHGQVTQINARYTVVRGGDGVESVIPNEMLVAAAVQNYSLTDRSQRLATQITVDYQSDIEQVMPLLENTVADIDRVMKHPAPKALLLQFGVDGIALEIGFWIEDPESGRGNLLSDVNRKIWHTLKAHDIKMAYPKT